MKRDESRIPEFDAVLTHHNRSVKAETPLHSAEEPSVLSLETVLGFVVAVHHVTALTRVDACHERAILVDTKR